MDRGGYAYVSPVVGLTNITGQAGFSLTYAKAIFNKTSNNIWLMYFNIAWTQNAGTAGSITIPNIVANGSQYFPTTTLSAVSMLRCTIADGGGITSLASSANATNWYSNGVIILASKPTAYLPDGV